MKLARSAPLAMFSFFLRNALLSTSFMFYLVGPYLNSLVFPSWLLDFTIPPVMRFRQIDCKELPGSAWNWKCLFTRSLFGGKGDDTICEQATEKLQKFLNLPQRVQGLWEADKSVRYLLRKIFLSQNCFISFIQTNAYIQLVVETTSFLCYLNSSQHFASFKIQSLT